MGAWTRRSLIDGENQGPHCGERALGLRAVLLLGIGNTIGAGIFVLAGVAAAKFAGPAVVLSFLFGALACLCAGLCYCEFASISPSRGGAYTYAYAVLGELPAWVIAWLLLAVYTLGAAAISIGWSGYFTELAVSLGIDIPQAWARAPYALAAKLTLQCTGAFFNLPAAIVIAMLSALLLTGMRTTARFNALVVAVKLCILLLVIAVGIHYAKPENWSPFVPKNTGRFGAFGWTGIVRGTGVVLFAYMGFDTISALVRDVRRPQVNLPLGIIYSLLFCALLYMFVALALTGVVSYRQLDVANPLSIVMHATGIGWLELVVNIGAVCGLTSVILVLLLALSRIVLFLAEDGLLPRVFSLTTRRGRVPAAAVVLFGAIASVTAGLIDLGSLSALISGSILIVYGIVCCAMIVLRLRCPELPRAFRVPLFPFPPIIGCAVCCLLAVSTLLDAWPLLALWLLIGGAVYALYGWRHSTSRRTVTTNVHVQRPID